MDLLRTNQLQFLGIPNTGNVRVTNFVIGLKCTYVLIDDLSDTLHGLLNNNMIQYWVIFKQKSYSAIDVGLF